MATVEDIERRVIALETAQNTNASTLRWVAGTLGQIQAVVDDHTGRLERIENTQADHTNRHQRLEHTQTDHTNRLERVESEIKGLRSDVRGLKESMPEIVATAMREVLAKK